MTTFFDDHSPFTRLADIGGGHGFLLARRRDTAAATARRPSRAIRAR